MNQENKRKPYSNYSWAIVVVLLALAVAILQSVYNKNDFFLGDSNLIFIVSSFIGGYIVYSIVYNIGKAIFGKIAKMEFVSLNLLFFEIKKVKGKLTVDFAIPEGWSGNAHMVEKEGKECSPILFHFGGLFTYLIVAVLSSVVCFLLDDTRKLLYISLVVACVGLLVLVVNLLPFYTDGVNDGFAIRLLLNKDNRRAYLDNCKQYAALMYNHNELFETKYDHYDDVLQAESLAYLYHYYMVQKDYENAKKVCDLMIENEKFLALESRQLAYNGKLYFMLLSESDETCYDYYYSLNKDYRNYSISKSSLECIKVGLLISSKVERSYELYDYLLSQYHKVIDSFYEVRKDSELQLIDEAIALVEEKHPEWKNEE